MRPSRRGRNTFSDGDAESSDQHFSDLRSPRIACPHMMYLPEPLGEVIIVREVSAPNTIPCRPEEEVCYKVRTSRKMGRFSHGIPSELRTKV